ncbi:hypothetical protein [Halosimplex sp. J119]
MSESTSEDGFNRRNVLKSVAAGTAATVGASGVASASASGSSISLATKRDITAEYRDIDTIRQQFRAHRDLLEAAVEAEHVDEPSFDIFDVEVDGMTSERGDGLGFNAREVDGEVIPEIRVLHRTDEGEVMFGIRPTEDAGYVNFFPAEEDTVEQVYEKNWSYNTADCCSGCQFCGGNCDDNQSCETLTSSCCCWATCKNMTCAGYRCVCESDCGWL